MENLYMGVSASGQQLIHRRELETVCFVISGVAMSGIVRRLRQQLMITLVNIALITGVFLGTIGTAQGGASVTPRESSKGASDDQQKQIAAIKSITRVAIKEYNLKALIVQVTAAGQQLYTEALGESMSGVPATPAMHFRNG